MNAKQGFHWKSIEEKPDNWEKLHRLIQSVYIDTSKQQTGISETEWMKPMWTEIALQLFPELKRYTIPLNTTTTTTKKTPIMSNKDKIKLSVEKERIKKDLQMIKFDETLKPISFHFQMEMTFFWMIIVWCHKLLIQKNPNKLNLLDAIISLNRMMDQLVLSPMVQQESSIYLMMKQVQTKINTNIPEEMYHLLFQNPVFLIQSTADKRHSSIQLYKEQLELIDRVSESVLTNKPLLMGNQMPTGTGKTFLAIPLAQKIQKLKCKKTLLFACSNELVNQEIASMSLLGDNLHLWLSRLIRDEQNNAQVLLRPYKRCFSDKWKTVYKMTDTDKVGTIQEQWKFYVRKTEKVPDIIVADLESCYEILKHANEIGNPFIAYIDEFISDRYSNELMGKICHYLPKQTVLLSAILPSFESLDFLIQSFEKRHGCSREECLYRVKTCHVPITCAIINHEGKIMMPHHVIQKKEDLSRLLQEIQVNPRIRRCYTAKHVYYWSVYMKSILPPSLHFQHCFPNIGRITNQNIVEYTIQILQWLEEHFDEYLKQVQGYSPQVMDEPSLEKCFTTQTRFFDGKTLLITTEVSRLLYETTDALFQKQVKWTELWKQTQRNELHKQERLEKLEKMKTQHGKDRSGKDKNMNKLEMERLFSEASDTDTTCMLPKEYVLNSREHFIKYHPQSQKIPRHIHRLPNLLPPTFNDGFDEQQNLNLSSGIGSYDKTIMTPYQRQLMMSFYKQLFFICSNKDIVFGTNLPELVNIFITSDFVQKETISTLYQLMGRVGRMGRSYHANIILDSQESVDKILCLEDNIDTIEIMTLGDAFKAYSIPVKETVEVVVS